MNQLLTKLVSASIVLAALFLLIGSIGRFILPGDILNIPPNTYWRGTIALLGFAIALALVQIRDKG
jgi:hypothetical protein